MCGIPPYRWLAARRFDHFWDMRLNRVTAPRPGVVPQRVHSRFRTHRHCCPTGSNCHRHNSKAHLLPTMSSNRAVESNNTDQFRGRPDPNRHNRRPTSAMPASARMGKCETRGPDSDEHHPRRSDPVHSFVTHNDTSGDRFQVTTTVKYPKPQNQLTRRSLANTTWKHRCSSRLSSHSRVAVLINACFSLRHA